MSGKLLIIEDDEINRKLARDILQHHGYEVMEAENCQKGISMAREKSPDLILMDIQVPYMDGVTAVGILKNDPATRDIKIIALTSFAMKGDRERMLEAGFDDYMAKPIDTRELPSFLDRCLLKKDNRG